jgi:putative transposase
MRRRGLRAIYQKPRTTVQGDLSEQCPCLLDLKKIKAVDQVWAADITDIPLKMGFLYLVAIMDIQPRHVLSWKLSNSLETELCLEAQEMAISSGHRPQIFHYDEEYQLTSSDCVARLEGGEIKISWSGRKRFYDYILVEKLWRTLKYEEVYLRAYQDGWEAEISLARFLWRYCYVRAHSSLGGKTTYAFYTESGPSPSHLEFTTSGAKAVVKKARTSLICIVTSGWNVSL